MSDFVYDNLSTPSGKTDNRPLSVAANKAVTATEWNAVMQYLEDIRGAILAGQFLGLSDDLVAAVSAADGVRLRSKGGYLQASEGAASYRSVLPPSLNARDYGAVGDGTTDDYTALAAAISAAVSKKLPLVIDRVFALGTELDVPANCYLLGVDTTRCGFKAVGSQRSVLSVTGANTHVSKLTVNGNRAAGAGIRIENGSGSSNQAAFQHLNVNGNLYDGLELVGNNDSLSFEDVNCVSNGTVYCTSGWTSLLSYYGLTASGIAGTGTAAITAGSAVVTGTGTNFNALGLRRGDAFYIDHASLEAGVIASVDSATQITLAHPALSTKSGKDWAAGKGSGYREDLNSDNNINFVRGGRFRSNAAFGLIGGGLYGPKFQKCEIDYQMGYGICTYPDAGGGAFGMVVDHCYFEANGKGCIVQPSGEVTVVAPQGAITDLVQRHQGSYSLVSANGVKASGGGYTNTVDLTGYAGQIDGATPIATHTIDTAAGTAQHLKQLLVGTALTTWPSLENYCKFNVDGSNSTFETGQRLGSNVYPRFRINPADGREYKSGADQSSLAGAATNTNPSGINKIASGATSCVITNTYIPAVATRRVRIMVTPHGPLGEWWVIQTAGGGSFELKTTVAAPADTLFSWEILEFLA